MRQRNPICNGQLRAEMGDHPDKVMLHTAKVEGAVPAFGEAGLFSLKLGEEPFQRHASTGENSQIAVHRQDEFIGKQGIHSADRDCLLSPATKPF